MENKKLIACLNNYKIDAKIILSYLQKTKEKITKIDNNNVENYIYELESLKEEVENLNLKIHNAQMEYGICNYVGKNLDCRFDNILLKLTMDYNVEVLKLNDYKACIFPSNLNQSKLTIRFEFNDERISNSNKNEAFSKINKYLDEQIAKFTLRLEFINWVFTNKKNE